MSTLKFLSKATAVLMIILIVAGAIFVSGCGKYVQPDPDKKPVIELPDIPDEPDDPNEPEDPPDEPEDPPADVTYVDTVFYIADGDAISMWMTMGLFDYRGEINNLHVSCNYYGEYDIETNKSDKAVINIGTGASPVLMAGKSYAITLLNNGGAMPSGVQWELNEQSNGYFNLAETVDFKPGTVIVTPDVDIWYLIADLFPTGAEEDGVIDFYITIAEK